MRKQKYIKNVVTLDVDAGKCIGCGLCAIVCPHAVFEIKEKKAKIIDRDSCMECGACALNCKVDAIEVNSGVGCTAAVINKMLGRTDTESCCSDGSQKPCC